MNINIKFSHIIYGIIINLLLSGCAAKVVLPTVGMIEHHEDSPAVVLTEPVAKLNLKFATKEVVDKVRTISPNKKIIYGFSVSPELFQAQTTINAGDIDKGLELLEMAHIKAKTPFEHLYIDLYRIHALNLYGRMPEAESYLKAFEKQEIAFNQANLMSITLLADVQSKLGKTEIAIENYKKVLVQLSGWRFPTSYAGPPTNIEHLAWLAEVRSRVTLGLALAEFFQGNYAKSKVWALQSEQHAADIMGVLTHGLYGPFLGAANPDLFLAHGIALALYGTAQVYESKSPQAGEKAYQAAQVSFNKIGFIAGAAHIEVMRTKGLIDAGNTKEALVSAQQALVLAKASKLHDFIWRLEYLTGLAQLDNGDKKAAEKAFREAQVSVDVITGMLGRDAEKRRFGVGKSDISYQLARLTFERQDHAALFTDLERGRARAFVDMMADVPSFGNKQQAAVADIRKLDKQSRIQFYGNQMFRSHSSSVQENEQALIQQRRQVVERISRRDPDLASLLAIAPESLEKVLNSIEKNAMIAYFLPTHRDEKLRRLNISREGFSFEELSITGEQLASMLKSFRKTIGRRKRSDDDKYRKAISNAMQLDSWNSADSVYVVPSDVVHYLPWGALDINKPIMVLPTASWLLTASPLSQSSTKVILGDPEFSGELPQLPGAAVEAEYVAKLYQVTPLIGSDATKVSLRQKVGVGVEVLHLATHAQFNVESPLQSRLFLSKPGGYDSISVKELFENPLPAKLVVLSACETGIGEVTTGDDFLGLQRSFYLSGASTVISSLWQVDDNGTAVFMKTFHKAILAGSNYGQAWLKARNAVKAAGMPAWIYGAFIIGGKQQ